MVYSGAADAVAPLVLALPRKRLHLRIACALPSARKVACSTIGPPGEVALSFLALPSSRYPHSAQSPEPRSDIPARPRIEPLRRLIGRFADDEVDGVAIARSGSQRSSTIEWRPHSGPAITTISWCDAERAGACVRAQKLGSHRRITQAAPQPATIDVAPILGMAGQMVKRLGPVRLPG